MEVKQVHFNHVAAKGPERVSQEKSVKNVLNPLLDGKTKSSITESESSAKELPEKDIKTAVDALNDIFELGDARIKFSYYRELDRYYVQLVDKETHEVVKEIPPKELLDMVAKMHEVLGIIFDVKV